MSAHMFLNIVYVSTISLNVPTLYELCMNLSVPSFLHQEMRADGPSLASQHSVIINEGIGMACYLSLCQMKLQAQRYSGTC